jgi:hypothetical protein
MTDYRVNHGMFRGTSAACGSFETALRFYKTVAVTSIDGASITNDAFRCDEDDDGLTDEEREAIEQADIVIARWKRLRRRAADRLVETAVQLFRAPAWSMEELEAMAAIELARKRDPALAEWALDKGLTVACPGVTWFGARA